MTSPRPEQDKPAESSSHDEPRENTIVEWAKAILGGVGDTARDMLDEGRRGAREAMDDGWDRFDAKTRHRRK